MDISTQLLADRLAARSWDDFDIARRLLDVRDGAVSDLNATASVEDCLLVETLINKTLRQLTSGTEIGP